MNSEILSYYYTDSQVAAILGITLGGLRNKIYRGQKAHLPKFIELGSRTRLWPKDEVAAHLVSQYQGNQDVVDLLLKKGEETPPGGGFAECAGLARSSA